MFCNQCGNEIPNETKFCPNCGAPVEVPAQPEPAAPVYAQPVQEPQPQYAQPVQNQQPPYAQPIQQQYAQPEPVYAQTMPAPGNPEERSLAKNILVFGILAIAFACTYYLAFMGIVFGAITGGKVKEYIATYPLAGKAKVGSILGKVGLIVGIVLTVLSFITIIACTCSACSGSSGSYYYY